MLLQYLLMTLATATASATFILERDDMVELNFETVRKSRRTLGSNGCIRDTHTLEENKELQDSFQDVLNAFTENFSVHPHEYCTTTANGEIKSSKCIVDYSDFPKVEAFNKMCSDARATLYPVSILMRCSKEGGDLDMELMKIPSCVGKSCDSGHLYLTLINILSGIEASMGGSGAESEWDWRCTFYHDFESLKKAPATIIEIPDDDDGNTSAKTPDSREQSRGINHQYMTSLLIAILASGISSILH